MDIRRGLEEAGWFGEKGAYVLADGQFGSTGKGLAASVLASVMHDRVDYVSTNAGPNSGHTSYFKDEKIVLMQLPTFSVHAEKYGVPIDTFINAGAVVDLDRLEKELLTYKYVGRYWVNPCAAVVNKDDKVQEASDLKDRIGSTGKGTGAALASKIMREFGAVVRDCTNSGSLYFVAAPDHVGLELGVGLIEVPQGHSLGINQGFYPFTTSRDCGVSQALSDAQMHPSLYRDSMLVFRTYPIRVGGNSGPGYPDQREVSWNEIGQEPEITTVTGKVRRVFTWSDIQFMNAVAANKPGHIFLNFVNYLERKEHSAFLAHVVRKYIEVMGRVPKTVFLGHGPRIDDVELAYHG